MSELKTQKDRWAVGWYWGLSDDGPMYGPFPSQESALADMWNDDLAKKMFADAVEDDPGLTKDRYLSTYDWIAKLGHGPISTEVFDADNIMDDLEDRNDMHSWGDDPPTWPDADAKRELEQMLADALYRWGEKHDIWKQFRMLT